jgi:hypothetical protein
MEQKDIDIYEILKKEVYGTDLYTPMCGNVKYSFLESNKEAGEAIWTENKNGEYAFDKNGRWMKGGEVLLFPSKEMRDWSKFFKYGDILVNEDGDAHIIFVGYDDYTYKTLKGNYYLLENEGSTVTFGEYEDNLPTSQFKKANKENAQEYIRKIEERLGGKLNLETIEIEKSAFGIGKLYVFNEEDEDGELTIIGKLIGKNESDDTLTFGNQYEIETEKFVTDQTFDLNTSLHNELREATENEVELFNKHYAIWKKEKEEPDFKPFDKVLVRSGDNFKWIPAFFVRDRGEDFSARFNALPINIGTAADFSHCIPYEGHENIAFTDYDIENLPF